MQQCEVIEPEDAASNNPKTLVRQFRPAGLPAGSWPHTDPWWHSEPAKTAVCPAGELLPDVILRHSSILQAASSTLTSGCACGVTAFQVLASLQPGMTDMHRCVQLACVLK